MTEPHGTMACSVDSVAWTFGGKAQTAAFGMFPPVVGLTGGIEAFCWDIGQLIWAVSSPLSICGIIAGGISQPSLVFIVTINVQKLPNT